MTRDISNKQLLQILTGYIAESGEIYLRQMLQSLRRTEWNIMAALDAAQTALKQLVDEDGLVIQGLNDLAAKAASGQGVSEADVQALADGIKAEVARVDATLQADVPPAQPAPAPADPSNPPTV